MRMDKSEESTLLIGLTEGLQSAEVTDFGYLRLKKEWEKDLQQGLDGEFSRRLYARLDDGGLESLLRQQIMIKFHEAGCKFPAKSARGEHKAVPLSSYDLFSDSLKIAKEIVDYIKGSQKQYELICVAFHQREIWNEDFELKISDRLSLISGKILRDRFVTCHANNEIDALLRAYNANNDTAKEIDKEKIYFLYKTSGILSDRTRSRVFSDFYDYIRSFYGICLSFDLMHYLSFFKSGDPVYSIANLMGDGRTFCGAELVETDLSEVADSMFSKQKLSNLGDEGSPQKYFQPVIDVFKSNEAQKIRIAAIWLLRSYLSDKGMDKILDASISIEVLLGDRDASDRIGLSKLMANRCAYALGRSTKDRKEIYEFFLNFYKVRSEVVHSGRLRISKEESEVVNRGVELAARILRHEARMN